MMNKDEERDFAKKVIEELESIRNANFWQSAIIAGLLLGLLLSNAI